MLNADLIVSIETGAALLSVLLGITYVFAMGSARGVHVVRVLSMCLTLLFASAVGWGKFYTHRTATISVKDIEANPAQAIDKLTRALRVDPAYGPLYFKRGVAYSKSNEPRRAYGDLEKAATLSRQSLPLAEELAKVATSLGYTDEARAFVAEVLAKDPNNFDALNARGIIESRQRQYLDALKDFEFALRVAQDDEERFIAHSNAALPLSALKLYDEALAHLRAAEKLRPNDANVLGEIANTYGQKAYLGGDSEYHRLALETANRALAIDPHQDLAGMTRAAALFYLGDRGEAIKELSELIRLHPEDLELPALKAGMENYQNGSKLPALTLLTLPREGLQR
jgi:tetratricopeptide (TPR) repeat protein